MLDVVAAANEEADDGDNVGDVQQDDAGSDHAVKCGGGSEVQQAQETDDEAAGGMRHPGDIEFRVDLGEKVVPGEAAIARKGPAESGLPRMRGNLASHPRG